MAAPTNRPEPAEAFPKFRSPAEFQSSEPLPPYDEIARLLEQEALDGAADGEPAEREAA